MSESEINSDELAKKRCSKGVQMSNSLVLSGIWIWILGFLIFGIIFMVYILRYFGIPNMIILIFLVVIVTSFILMFFGYCIYKKNCSGVDMDKVYDYMKKLEE